jgi:hypothetical protein
VSLPDPASLLIVIPEFQGARDITEKINRESSDISSSIHSFKSLYGNYQIIFCALLPLIPHPYRQNEARQPAASTRWMT